MVKTPVVLVLVLALGACGQPFLHPPPNIRPLAAKDWRQALVGKWIVELSLDSVQRLVQESHGVRSVMDPGPHRVVRGTLELRDTIVGVDGTDLRSTISFDFTRLLGHPLSCFSPTAGVTRVERNGRTVSISLTPGAADCGFFSQGQLDGDSLIGSWGEDAFVGARAAGKLRLLRDTTP